MRHVLALVYNNTLFRISRQKLAPTAFPQGPHHDAPLVRRGLHGDEAGFGRLGPVRGALRRPDLPADDVAAAAVGQDAPGQRGRADVPDRGDGPRQVGVPGRRHVGLADARHEPLQVGGHGQPGVAG